MVHLEKVRIELAEGAMAPAYATSGSSGMDLHASAPVDIAPGQIALIPCGFRIEIPKGYEGQIRPRSGLAIKHGITVMNAPGTVDSDYRGEVMVILANFGDKSFKVERYDRIAQLAISPVIQVELVLVAAKGLDETDRGEGGFGSTGEK